MKTDLDLALWCLGLFLAPMLFGRLYSFAFVTCLQCQGIDPNKLAQVADVGHQVRVRSRNFGILSTPHWVITGFYWWLRWPSLMWVMVASFLILLLVGALSIRSLKQRLGL